MYCLISKFNTVQRRAQVHVPAQCPYFQQEAAPIRQLNQARITDGANQKVAGDRHDRVRMPVTVTQGCDVAIVLETVQYVNSWLIKTPLSIVFY